MEKELDMISNIDVSVLMSVYNEESHWLIETIESILNQSYRDFEFIIILDNPLNFELKEIIKNYELKDVRVKVLINSENRGLVYSLNKGLKEAKGKYVVRIDADDIARNDRIEKQIEFLKSNEEYSLIGTNYKMIDESGNIIRDDIKTISNFSLLKRALKYRNIMCHPSYMFIKDDIINIGGYRQVKFAEDYDLVVRLIMNGKKISNIDERLLYYRVRQNGISKSNSYVQRLSSYVIQENYIRNNINFDIELKEIGSKKYKIKYYKNKIIYKILETVSHIYESIRRKAWKKGTN